MCLRSDLADRLAIVVPAVREAHYLASCVTAMSAWPKANRFQQTCLLPTTQR